MLNGVAGNPDLLLTTTRSGLGYIRRVIFQSGRYERKNETHPQKFCFSDEHTSSGVNAMAVYVDNANILWRNAHWCHMLADSLDELHMFAQQMGVKRRWFHRNASYPHYDITSEMRGYALSEGALRGNRASIIFCAKRLKVELAGVAFREDLLVHCRQKSVLAVQADFFRSANLIA